MFWNGLSLHFFAAQHVLLSKNSFSPYGKKREIPRVQIKDDLMLATILLLLVWSCCSAFSKRASLMIATTMYNYPQKEGQFSTLINHVRIFYENDIICYFAVIWHETLERRGKEISFFSCLGSNKDESISGNQLGIQKVVGELETFSYSFLIEKREKSF